MRRLPVSGRTLALIGVLLLLFASFAFVALRSGPLAPVPVTVMAVESRSLTPALSPADELGPIAATQMLARIETGAFGSRDIVLPVELRIAGSTLRR